MHRTHMARFMRRDVHTIYCIIISLRRLKNKNLCKLQYKTRLNIHDIQASLSLITKSNRQLDTIHNLYINF